MYLQHFSLRRSPFAAETDIERLYVSETTRETDKRLMHLVECRGIGLLTGEPGVGKTIACMRLVGGLKGGVHRTVYRPLAASSPLEALNALGSELGLPPRATRAAARQGIGLELARCDRNRVLPVVVIDEAHLLKDAVLEELRLVVSIDFDSEVRCCLLLVGLPKLRRRLRRGVNRSLQQRLIVNCGIEPLTEGQCAEYIAHRLEAAGGPDMPLFEESAVVAVAQRSQGLPRMINRIAHYAMVDAAVHNKRQVTTDSVGAAVDELRL